MFKVLDVFYIGDMVSITLEGSCDSISNGTRLTDNNGNTIVVESVAMTRHDNPSDINKSTTLLAKSCGVKKGCSLYIA